MSLVVVPLKDGRSLDDHFNLNRDFIRQCHEENMSVRDIGTCLLYTSPSPRDS